MSKTYKVISPVDSDVYLQRHYATDTEIAEALDQCKKAQAQWQHVSVEDRGSILAIAMEAFSRHSAVISEQLSWQMGRPIQYGPGEVKGFVERGLAMIGMAQDKLVNIRPPHTTDTHCYIERQPLGIVFSMVPWNYPFLTAVNSVIPALMAGNGVVMKPSSQTPLAADMIERVLYEANLPAGLFQNLSLTHEATGKIVQSGAIHYVAFTGSVTGGKMVEAAAVGRFIDVGLELGGKDPAYVRPDANLKHAVNNLVDGAFFNSGQSCCGIERIYVHKDCYNDFVAEFVDLVGCYQLGNPLDSGTTLGPMVSAKAADRIRQQTHNALANGAKTCIDTSAFSHHKEDSPYIAPQVLVNVDHSMQVMQDESFGPIVGIMQVDSDNTAIGLMNDSQFGLTASIWTQDEAAAIALGKQVQTGTLFMNRCDYLDPALAWVGVKNSGRGCTLSEVGYEKLTRPKSFNLRKVD